MSACRAHKPLLISVSLVLNDETSVWTDLESQKLLIEHKFCVFADQIQIADKFFILKKINDSFMTS
jgi:hypothetical protein